VQRSLPHLPAGESTLAELHWLSACLASQRGDVKLERLALERLIGADPANFAALDQLAQLAEKDGQPAQATELIRKKAEINLFCFSRNGKNKALE
jgi:hypothetical protein